MRQPSCFARSAGIRPGRAIANHTDTLGPAPDRGPQARNLLERRQHLIQTLITHGLVVGPHVTISITGFSQKLPTEQRAGGQAGREEGLEEQGPRATLGQWSKRCGAYLKMFHFEATSARTDLHN